MSHRPEEGGWSPYVAGALVGLLVIASTFLTTTVMGKATHFDTSVIYARTSAMIERAVLPERVEKNDYFKKEPAKVDWQFMLVCGIFIGALTSALTRGAFEWESVPQTWALHFGRNPLKRAVWAIVGGALVMFGARMADGCLAEHGLSGVMQFSASGIAALLCFMIGGVTVAEFLYGKGDRHE